jgi:hypothetical protein
MSTWNGCGTTYYGWEHKEDGTAIATNWIVVLMFPLVPMKRVHLRSLSPDNDRFLNLRPVVDHYDLIKTLDRDYRSIVETLVRAYILFPIVLLLPIILFIGVLIVAQSLGYADAVIDGVLKPAYPVFLGISVLYWIALGLIVLRTSRGRRSM